MNQGGHGLSNLFAYWALFRHLGPGWLLYRAGYAMRQRSGLLRRASPVMEWAQVPVTALALHAHAKPAVPLTWGNSCVGEAEAVLRGKFRLFSSQTVAAGFPPDWRENQLTKYKMLRIAGNVEKTQKHWTDISDSGTDDVKGVWELSRFPWAFPLVRASARTGDVRFGTAFWQLFADWCRLNPPNLGPNWMCGQEATFRLMAVVFAAENIGVPKVQRALLAQLVVTTGRRISANLDYALSQKNNHGVSECVGLVTAALLLPDHKPSMGWLARGLKELELQLAELVYEDGGFSQHALIYHRVLLHDLCWCRRRLELAGRGSPSWLTAAGTRAVEFLQTITDPRTGQAALYGPNDGADVLPLSEADFLDMRPVVQMASAVFRNELPLPPGPWDEAVAWIRSDWSSLPRVIWPAMPARWHAPVAGCFQMVQGDDRLFLRCPTQFRHRPSQADMLHVDVWHLGRPVVYDGGTFSYNSKERFTAFKDAAHHNVLVVDETEPLRKFSRFLYLPWPRGQTAETSGGVFQAGHDGYATLGIRWLREVSTRAGSSGFTVRDKVSGAAGHRLQWQWRLADVPWQLNEACDAIEVRASDLAYRLSWAGVPHGRSRLLRADKTTAYGWWSPYYGSVIPATALLYEVEAEGEIELVTEFQALK